MELAILGLGKMGANMARRLARGGHRVVVYNRTTAKALALAEEHPNIEAVTDLAALRTMLRPPRVAWMMLPAGDTTEAMFRRLLEILEPGDILVDGGNAYYKDSMRRAEEARAHGFHFVDVGVSGGIWGLEYGYSLMVGGEKDAVERLRPVLETLAPAPDKGWGHVGPNGAGHFVKMVHNGIEYGMMQALAEGFEILRAKGEFALDLKQVAEIWRFGSVIRSWLLDLIARALEEEPDLRSIQGWVPDSGEGRWTVVEAIDLDVPAPVIALSLFMRFVSRQDESFAAKMLAAMRHQFGGHPVKRVEDNPEARP